MAQNKSLPAKEDADIPPVSRSTIYDLIEKKIMGTKATRKLTKVLNDPVSRKEISHFPDNGYRDLGKVITEV